MRTYDLYVESGPMEKKTVVHVPALIGCVAHGDTSQEAINSAPDAIRTFLRFLQRADERVAPDAKFETCVAAHDKSGGFIGIGFLETDAEPLRKPESDRLMKRLDELHGELRRTTSALTPARLASKPATGRPIAQILQHVCGAEGSYLRGVTGASRIATEVERGRRTALDALDELLQLEKERLRTMPDDERSQVIMRGKSQWSARFAVRRMLEHAWEHHVEIAERLGVEP